MAQSRGHRQFVRHRTRAWFFIILQKIDQLEFEGATRPSNPSPSGGVWWAFGPPLWAFGPPIWAYTTRCCSQYRHFSIITFTFRQLFSTSIFQQMSVCAYKTLPLLGHPWHHGSSWYVILDLCAKFHLSSMNRSVSRTPVLEVILGGCWWFLTGNLKDGVIFEFIYHLERPQ